MPKIRSPRARAAKDQHAVPAAAASPGKKATSDLAIWYHANKQWLPLVATVFGGAALYLLSQVEVLRPYMGFIGGLVMIVGAVVYGMMKPEDAPVRVGRNRAMPLVLLVGALTLGAALLPYLHTNFPGTPRYHGTLSAAHPRASFALDSDRGIIEILTHGQLRRGTSSATGGFAMVLEHDGHKRRVDGAFKRTYSARKIRRGRVKIGTSSDFAYHVSQLPSLGKGRYTLTYREVDASLHNYLRIKVFHAWYTERTLIYALIALVILGLGVDIASTRFRHRTKMATAALVAVGFSIYFGRQFAPDSVMSTVLGGGLVAILAGWIGGFVLSWLTQLIGREPKFVKAPAPEDDD